MVQQVFVEETRRKKEEWKQKVDFIQKDFTPLPFFFSILAKLLRFL